MDKIDTYTILVFGLLAIGYCVLVFIDMLYLLR
jgi:hypothetical protein